MGGESDKPYPAVTPMNFYTNISVTIVTRLWW